MQIKQIAYIRSDFVEKFGIPRQSKLVDTRQKSIFCRNIECGCAAGKERRMIICG